MGYEGIKTALAAAKGERYRAIDTGLSLITKANMNSPRSQELLNRESNNPGECDATSLKRG